MFQRKEQDKTLEEISNVEIDNLPERVQSNDSKHDLRSQKNNGRTGQKVIRCLTKKQEYVKNKLKELNDTVTGIKKYTSRNQ